MGNAAEMRAAEWEAQRVADVSKVFRSEYAKQLDDPKAALLEETAADVGLAINHEQRTHWFALDLAEKDAVITHLLYGERDAERREARAVAKGYRGALKALAKAFGLEVTAARRAAWREMNRSQLHALVAYVGEHRAFPADG